MPANIFGSRFTSRDTAAWWDVSKKHIHRADLTAIQAIEGKDYNVDLVPMYVPKKYGIEIPQKAIIRHPVADDPQFRFFGIGGPEYTLITPRECAGIWDYAVAKPVETVGMLGHGELMFITTKLPTVDVKGDEVENYLGLISPMDGMRAASAEVFPVRVVCSNTLKLAQQMATEVYRVIHDEKAKERLAGWLTDIYTHAEAKVKVIREAFNAMASHTVSKRELATVLSETYPQPNPPRVDAPDDVMKIRFERWESIKTRQARRVTTVEEFFAGGGTGMTVKACQGTAWGLYNAITEVEDWRRSNNERDLDSVTSNILFGQRAETKRRGFEACASISGVKEFAAVR